MLTLVTESKLVRQEQHKATGAERNWHFFPQSSYLAVIATM